MSGGRFGYKQYEICYIADEVEQLIRMNNDTTLDEWGVQRGHEYSDATIEEFKKALKCLQQAEIYAHRIDWLVSGDDSEDSFHERLNEEMLELYENYKTK